MHTSPARLAMFFAPLLTVWGHATMAQEAHYIAVPVDGRLQLWDMRGETAEAAHLQLPNDAVAGGCYSVSGNNQATLQASKSCLEYYTFKQPLDKLPKFSVSGHIAFNDVKPDNAYRGLEVRGVDGISDCGEREDCSTVYIAGFTNIELTAKVYAAARDGRRMTLSGRKFWNAESIDMIVERIVPLS